RLDFASYQHISVSGDHQRAGSSPSTSSDDLYQRNLPTPKGFTYLWTTFNWTVIILISLVCLHFLPNYSHLYGRLLRISNYDQFVLNALAILVLMECLWFASYRDHRVGRNAALDLVFHYSKVLDSKLSPF